MRNQNTNILKATIKDIIVAFICIAIIFFTIYIAWGSEISLAISLVNKISIDTSKKVLEEVKLNIKTEEIMTIGDNSNDIEMIKNAGLGIAMANSAPEIKKIADDITTSNEENGVGQAIERNITKILQTN